jgi:hypothetical protein
MVTPGSYLESFQEGNLEGRGSTTEPGSDLDKMELGIWEGLGARICKVDTGRKRVGYRRPPASRAPLELAAE